MLIPVVLKNCHEEQVSKDKFQFLLAVNEVLFFKHSDGWAVPGRDPLRHNNSNFNGEERREHDVYTLN